MKSIQSPSSKVSTQWVSPEPVHSKWEFILCLHKYFTRPPPFQQLSSCNNYCITNCKQLGNTLTIFYPYSFLLQPSNFPVVQMLQGILVSQFKCCWRVPQVWMSVNFVTTDSLLVFALLHILCPGRLSCTFPQLSSQSLWFPQEWPMIQHSWLLHNITNLLLSPEWSFQGSKYSLQASPCLVRKPPPMCYKWQWHKQTHHWIQRRACGCCPRTDRHTKGWKT